MIKVSTKTPEFQAVSKLLGNSNVTNALLWAYGLIESNLNPATPDSPTGAQGLWQVLPSTQKLLKKAYDLPPFTKADATVQSRYALAHVIEDHRALRRLGVPDMAKKIAAGDPLKEKLLALRFYYHNGPSTVPKRGTTNEIKGALLKYSKMLSQLSPTLFGEPAAETTQVMLSQANYY